DPTNLFFVLDSAGMASLTLRDYSKVVAGYKQFVFQQSQTFPGCVEGAMSVSGARRSRLCLRVASLAILASSVLSFAQGTGGRILGRVSDPSGAVLSGARVVATNDATAVSHDALTNDSGDYVFPELPVGTYSLTFDLTGFKKAIRHGITLDVNQVITLNMAMQLGGAQE